MGDVNWDTCSQLGSLRPVLDPRDETGRKNLLIDRIHWRALRKHLANTKSLLDFGCGIGRWLPRTTTLGIEYRGIDTSLGMIEAARKLHGQSNVTFRHFNGLEIPFPDSRFDVVLSSLVFMYVLRTVSCQAVLSELRRVLKPGGRFVLIEQASLSNQKSGSASHVLVESDYISLLTDNHFTIRHLHRLRSSQFSKLSEAFLSSKGFWGHSFLPDSILAILLASLTEFESWRVSRMPDSCLMNVPYYEFLLDATLVK